MRAYVVIGAGYGDEGKGLTVDALCRRFNVGTVVRFNGGAQAGHTVVDGPRRHVFGHVGSGTFAGASTHLGPRFIVNPLLLAPELDRLRGLGVQTTVTVDPRARVSTIYDMALNAMAELARGDQRHGSCGMGINETVTRHAQLPLTVSELGWSLPSLRRIIEQIRHEYVPQRMAALGVLEVPPAIQAVLDMSPHVVTTRLLTDFHTATTVDASHIQHMIDPTRAMYAGGGVTSATPIVLEGAQGLGLDERLGRFPHVTRSLTGLPYAVVAAAELGAREIVPVYVTRTYVTRHGAGPLAFEGKLPQPPQDLTNQPNQWQGTLRHAPLAVPELRGRITEDLARGAAVAQAHDVALAPARLVVTCLDQLDSVPVVGLGPNPIATSQVWSEQLAGLLAGQLGLSLLGVSRGPSASTFDFGV